MIPCTNPDGHFFVKGFCGNCNCSINSLRDVEEPIKIQGLMQSGETGGITEIDLTPTWSGILPALLEIMMSPRTDISKEFARAELEKMARVADAYVSSNKKESQG